MPKLGQLTFDLTNKQFGKWTVLCISEKRTKNGISWDCVCSCGYKSLIPGKSLRYGKSLGCRKCSMIEKRKSDKINRRFYRNLKRRAKARNLEFNFGNTEIESAEFLHNLLYVTQNCKCALSGVDIKIAPTSTIQKMGKFTTASLDRIDSNKGYTKDNVQWVHRDVNIMKMDFTQEEFIQNCINIAKYRGNI